MIYQATDVVNFAQGEMAMFSTYLAWTLLNAGLPYWVAFFATLAIAFVGGLLHRAHPDPSRRERARSSPSSSSRSGCSSSSTASPAGSTPTSRSPSPARSRRKPIQVGNIVFGAHDLGAIGVTLVVLACLFVFFRFTHAGPGHAGRRAESRVEPARAASAWAGCSRWAGGWRPSFGAVAGMMVAPVVFLDPNMMGGIQIYAFAAATLGGFTSPVGAVVGGLHRRA